MRDAATNQEDTVARLLIELDESECRRRNALTETAARRFALSAGEVGTVVETFGNGEAFLVEFSRGRDRGPDRCDWMGVLYPGEVEIGGTVSRPPSQ